MVTEERIWDTATKRLDALEQAVVAEQLRGERP